jgi:hypothetical protein
VTCCSIIFINLSRNLLVSLCVTMYLVLFMIGRVWLLESFSLQSTYFRIL